jgi:nitroreductase
MSHADFLVEATVRQANQMDHLPPASLRETRALILGRQNVAPRWLREPGPSADQLEQLLEVAAAAPDHGQLAPWRFILIPENARPRLGEVFRDALLERDSDATPEQLTQAAEKAFRAPCLFLAVSDLGPKQVAIPAAERLVSLGCAIQNMLLLARAMGYASGLSSGQALTSAVLRSAFALAEHEQAICFVSFGTAARTRPIRSRPSTGDILSTFPANRTVGVTRLNAMADAR